MWEWGGGVRERLSVETGLVVVGGADSTLRISRRKKKVQQRTSPPNFVLPDPGIRGPQQCPQYGSQIWILTYPDLDHRLLCKIDLHCKFINKNYI